MASGSPDIAGATEVTEQESSNRRCKHDDLASEGECILSIGLPVLTCAYCEIERLRAALKRYEDLEIHLSTGGKPDERVYTRKDVEMFVAICRAGERAAFETTPLQRAIEDKGRLLDELFGEPKK